VSSVVRGAIPVRGSPSFVSGLSATQSVVLLRSPTLISPHLTTPPDLWYKSFGRI